LNLSFVILQSCCSSCQAPPYTSDNLMCSMQLPTDTNIYLQVDDIIYCYYQDLNRMSKYKHITLQHSLIVNMTLWPSFLFITGFVGMFFSCIQMQQAMEELRKRKRKQSSLRILADNSCIMDSKLNIDEV
jgi:hypothetical protein